MSESGQSSGLLIGPEFSQYRIIEEIASGRLGVIFCALDSYVEREVDTKVLRLGANRDVDCHSGESGRDRSPPNGDPVYVVKQSRKGVVHTQITTRHNNGPRDE